MRLPYGVYPSSRIFPSDMSCTSLTCISLITSKPPQTRYEEKRSREAWRFLRHLEEAARGEELVRMRAEERFTRSLLDLELEDARRVEIIQRETKEKAKMWKEDLAVRDLDRLEKAQMVEREAMRTEDALARLWENTLECVTQGLGLGDMKNQLLRLLNLHTPYFMARWSVKLRRCLWDLDF